VRLTIERIAGHWWIVGDEEFGPYGPYETKAEAEEDRRGIKRFDRREDEKGYVTTDRTKTVEETK